MAAGAIKSASQTGTSTHPWGRLAQCHLLFIEDEVLGEPWRPGIAGVFAGILMIAGEDAGDPRAAHRFSLSPVYDNVCVRAMAVRRPVQL
jgi:hypothetical protein